MKTHDVGILAALLALAGCGGSAAAPPASPPPAPPAGSPAACEAKSTKAIPSASGETIVTGGDGKPHALHWIKLEASAKPARGTLFYLAGGPISHMAYTDLAASFQRDAFPELDVVLYDYFGFNCSSAIQDTDTLRERFAGLTTPAMARDFIQLKRSLVGADRKVFVMGGSHGAMLGAEIVRDYPSEIEKAILFSGDTTAGWLDDGWFRFDDLIARLDRAHPGFAEGLTRLLESAERGQLVVQKDGKDVVVDRESLEIGMWAAFSLSSSAQASLPALVEAAEAGERKWIANVSGVARGLLEPPAHAAPPTESSVVTTFHRCTVWWPRSRRGPSAREARFFRHDSFVRYWNTLCRDYDALGEYPPVPPAAPVDVPILSWVGDQDTFDPTANRAHWSALTTKLSFFVMEGWSHDLGPKPKDGFERAVRVVRSFLAR